MYTQIIEGKTANEAGQGQNGHLAVKQNGTPDNAYPDGLENGDIVQIFAHNKDLTDDRAVPLITGIYIQSGHSEKAHILDAKNELVLSYKFLSPIFFSEMPVRVTRFTDETPKVIG